MNNIEYWKTITPIVTFLLGAGLTWWIKEIEKKRNKVETAVNEISTLSTDWYNQLNAIKQSFVMEVSENEIKKQFTEYSQNRAILSKILQDLEIISSSKHCQELSKSVDTFLQTVTFRTANKHRLSSSSHLCNWDFSNMKEMISTHKSFINWSNVIQTDKVGYTNLYEKYDSFKLFVSVVDELLQDINRSAGKALKKL